MELLLAFLIAFGVIQPNTRVAASLTESQAQQLVVDNGLKKDFVVFGQETDDF